MYILPRLGLKFRADDNWLPLKGGIGHILSRIIKNEAGGILHSMEFIPA